MCSLFYRKHSRKADKKQLSAPRVQGAALCIMLPEMENSGRKWEKIEHTLYRLYKNGKKIDTIFNEEKRNGG